MKDPEDEPVGIIKIFKKLTRGGRYRYIATVDSEGESEGAVRNSPGEAARAVTKYIRDENKCKI